MSTKILDIYNERMELVGQKPRDEVHRMGYWHKAFHCWILSQDRKGGNYVIFQHRSKSKDLVPDSLDISAAGHLETGEKPIDGVRELEEELGVEIKTDRLLFLGVHVEVYCEDKTINREFDYVYFLNDNRSIDEYRVQPEEVVGLARIRIEDGISLFTKAVPKINVERVSFDSNGRPEGPAFKDTLTIESFAGGERNNYFIKVFLLAKRYFEGDRLLFI